MRVPPSSKYPAGMEIVGTRLQPSMARRFRRLSKPSRARSWSALTSMRRERHASAHISLTPWNGLYGIRSRRCPDAVDLQPTSSRSVRVVPALGDPAPGYIVRGVAPSEYVDIPGRKISEPRAGDDRARIPKAPARPSTWSTSA
jgi:hypothetical protein